MKGMGWTGFGNLHITYNVALPEELSLEQYENVSAQQWKKMPLFIRA